MGVLVSAGMCVFPRHEFFFFLFKKLAIIQIELFLRLCYNMVFLSFRVALLLLVGFGFFFSVPQRTLFLLFLVLKLVALLTLPGEHLDLQVGFILCQGWP